MADAASPPPLPQAPPPYLPTHVPGPTDHGQLRPPLCPTGHRPSPSAHPFDEVLDSSLKMEGLGWLSQELKGLRFPWARAEA